MTRPTAPAVADAAVSAPLASPAPEPTKAVSGATAAGQGQQGGCCRSRRAVLGTAVAGATGLALAACAAPATPQAVPEATGEGKAVMKASELAVGAQGSVKINKAEVILYRQDEGTVLAYSAICTHAGCTVIPGDADRFHCPCHESYFNVADGSVAGGPAPRPLARYGAAIQGEDILVYL